jgi:hypothetical protein
LRLQLILDQAQSGALAEDKVASAIEADEPQLASLIRKAPPKLRHALILVLIGAVQVLASTELGNATSGTATQTALNHDVQRLEHTIDNEGAATRSAIESAVREAVDRYMAEQTSATARPRSEPAPKATSRKKRTDRAPKTFGQDKRKRR